MATPVEHAATADHGEMDEVSQLWATEGAKDENEGATGSEKDPKAAENNDPEENKAGDTPASEGDKDEGHEEKPEPEAKPAEAAAEEVVDFTPPAWISLLPEDTREQALADFKQSRGSVKANALRVSALTKHLEETRRQLQNAQATSTKMPALNLTPDKSMEEVEREYPEVAAYVKAMSAQLQQQVAAHNQSISKPLIDAHNAHVNAMTEEQQAIIDGHKDAERTRVRKAVPDVDVIVQQPEFRNWLEAQAPGIQSLVHSPSADDNITLFSMYKGSRPVVPRKNLADHAELPVKGKTAVAVQTEDENVDPVDLWNREYFSKK